MKKWIYILALFFTNQCFAQNFDINTLKQTNLNRNKNLDGFFCSISNSLQYVIVAQPLGYYITGIATKNKKLQAKGIDGIFSLGINGAATYILKQSFDRPRPAVTYPFLTPLENRTRFSWPSGHTSSAFNMATTISLQTKKWYIILPAFTYASLTGYSRMHIGVHYPSDVISGAMLGTASALISHRVTTFLQNSKKTKKAYQSILF